MGTHEDEILEVGLRFCFTKVDGQKLAICEVNCYGNNASKSCNLTTLQ